jgi:hypothetical protein
MFFNRKSKMKEQHKKPADQVLREKVSAAMHEARAAGVHGVVIRRTIQAVADEQAQHIAMNTRPY